MGRYRARDLLLVPNLLSLSRVGLAIGFVLLVAAPPAQLLVLAVAGLSDVLDGWYARRFGQTSATGAVVDPITDKLFVLAVVVTLMAVGRLEPWAIPLLAAREIGELPLLVWWIFSRARRRARAEDPVANVPGKVATGMQFIAVAMAVLELRHLQLALYLSGAVGVVAAIVYWQREWRRP